MAQETKGFDSSILNLKPFYEYDFSDSTILGNDTIYIERDSIDNFISLIVKDSIVKQKSPIIKLDELDKYEVCPFEGVGIVKYCYGFIVRYYFPSRLGTGSYIIYDVFWKKSPNAYYRFESFFLPGDRYYQTFEKFHDKLVSLDEYFPQNENYINEEGLNLLCRCFNYYDEECEQVVESYNKQIQKAYSDNDTITMCNLSDVIVIQMAIRHSFEPISEDIVGYNNSAYYLEQKGFYFSAVYLLRKILEVAPNRTVAYINLGDAYWGLKEIENAKEAYKKYIKLMKANGKENKIPKRIMERLKE